MKITFIGGGNMADALIGGLLRKGFPLHDLRVVEVRVDARRKLEDKYGVTCFDKPKDALRASDIVVFAVKPQHLREAAAKSGITGNSNLVISIAAGVRLANLSKWLKGHTRLVRAMPNTPAMIGEGITGLYPFSKDVTREHREQAETVLGAVGATVWITEEAQMDVVTAISGSGPAYVFYFIEAVEDAARELGLPVPIAHQLVLNTFSGAAKLAATSPDPVAVLRERVTSKGGTTERALASMAKDEVKEAIIRAIHAANQRGKELGDELAKEEEAPPPQHPERESRKGKR
jgi:pyrroline-5-carboxylate reductase